MDKADQMQAAEQRLEELRMEMDGFEESTGRYLSLGEWRISGYSNEAKHDSLCAEEDELIALINKLDEELYYEQ